ncbi:MAG: hypothetical protein WA990_12910 [Rubrobacteraceae bacterium]
MKELHRVKIPDAVAAELEELQNAPGSQAPSLAWVERRSPGARYIGMVASEPPALDSGELEAIALALETGATVVVDDRRGRKRARMLGVSLTGTLGVLRALHRTGRARRSLVEDLEALEAAGMYLTPHLKQQAINTLHNG